MRMGRFLAASLGLLWGMQALALPFTPTQDQIEQFKRMSPDQQRQIAQKYGIDPSMIGGLTGGAAATPAPLYQPDVVAPRSNTDQGAQPAEAAVTNTRPADQAYLAQSGLKRFGYDLFAGSPSTFAPVSDVPIPGEYVLGPGDVLQVQLYGSRNETQQLQVDREGRINFPGLGPINLAGMSFEKASEVILKKVSQQMVGVQASITMGDLRSMRVFVLGDAYRPGSYTVSALSTITNALYVSGGIRDIGSLRDIQLKRNGRLVGTLDLYDLLLKGDTSKDLRLQPGDVIFIAPVGASAAISGRVKRPAIYELKPGDTVDTLVRMAGGLNADAYSSISVMERITADKTRSVRNLNLADRSALGIALRDGDRLDIRALGSRLAQSVELSGALERPGQYEWHAGLRIADLIHDPHTDLVQDADLNYGIVVRERSLRGDIEVLQFDPGLALSSPSSDQNLELKPRDKIMFFLRGQELLPDEMGDDATHKPPVRESAGKAGVPAVNTPGAAGMAAGPQGAGQPGVAGQSATVGAGPMTAMAPAAADQAPAGDRDDMLRGVLRQLYQQSRNGELVASITIDGEVHFPGEYPLPANGSVLSVLNAAGGLRDSALASSAEITRVNTAGGKEAKVEHLILNLADADAVAHFRLSGRDRVMIRQIADWSGVLKIELRGEVRHPGVYTFRRGETLSQVIQRAGGLSAFAYPRGALFTRKELKMREQERLQEFEAKLNADLASQSLTAEANKNPSADPTKIIQMTQMLEQVRKTRATGRVVIDLSKIIKDPKDLDVILEDGDSLAIPREMQTVTVIGEVQNPTSHLYDAHLSMKDYLDMSGGYTARADDGRVYVIQANGAVKMPGKTLWFNDDISKLEPGDTIVAPLNTNYLSSLTMWTQISQIIFQSAVTIATIAHL